MDSPLSPDPAAGHEPFDRASLMDRLLEDDDLVRELVEAFLDDTPVQVSALEAAFAAGDILQTERLAHRIKGAAANLSACRLQQVAHALELIARAGNREEAGQLVPLMGAEFLRAKQAMLASLAP
jgi:HPt (histidine-containing phosphotransfer) domain-containing protein